MAVTLRPPLSVPWDLKPVSSATAGSETLPRRDLPRIRSSPLLLPPHRLEHTTGPRPVSVQGRRHNR